MLLICQLITSSRSTNGQIAPKEREKEGEKVQKHIVRGSYPLPLISKGEKEQKHEDKGIIGHRGTMSVSINVKGGDCWKIDFH
jgi:hypothetical protein